MIPLKDDNPTTIFPYVTIAIIVLNVVVFGYEVALGSSGVGRFIFKTAVIPFEIVNFVDLKPAGIVPPPATLITAMFVHGGLLHLAGNMLFLWIFGDNIEDRLGHLWFLVFYLVAGIAAGLTHVALEPVSLKPMIGASGAIAGVLGAYFFLYPRAKVYTLIYFFFFINVIKIPALFFLGLWFLLQILSSAATTPGGNGVAWFAHIGGFVAGLVLIVAFGGRRGKREKT